MESDSFIFCIPSYKRADRQITVEYLNGIGVEKEKIFVFVQTEEDEKVYAETIGDKANIIMMPAKRGVEARNNILNKFSAQTDIIMLDDDIRAIGVKLGETIQKITNAESLESKFAKCLEICRRVNAEMLGIYPIYNHYFMERTISTRVTVNTVFGFLKGFKERFNEDYDTKEDAELCARMLTSGRRVLRFNHIAVDADHRKNKNGYIDEWHQRENIRCVKMLLLDFPSVFAPQKNKPWEVRTIIKDEKIIPKGGSRRSR